MTDPVLSVRNVTKRFGALIANEDVSLDLRGTDFQLAVYAEVARIPFGGSATYSEIAERV